MIELKNIKKSYGKHVILENMNLSIKEGEMIAITGESGSGKSTLLNILGLIEDFDEGEYVLENKKNIKINSKESQRMIRDNISYLFQNFALIENETVNDNLMIALKYYSRQKSKSDKKKIIHDALVNVGLRDYEQKKIFELSGGEQQRVAIARALIKPCKLLLADEPTGSLDAKNRDEILQLLKEINESGKTVIVVTHDSQVSDSIPRIIHL